jgi:hypothetical protein
VVLPDWQGIGIGIRLLEEIGKIYVKKDFRFTITTSTPAIIHSLKLPTWYCRFAGRVSKKRSIKNYKIKSLSYIRNTVSFELNKSIINL